MKKAKSGEIVPKSRGSTKAVLFSALPVHECLMAENMLETGLGSVWISRKLPNGKLAVGVFLLDIFCLGVKNAMLWEKMPQGQYEAMQAMSLGETLVPVKPCCATKLILEAAAYAESLGFNPHEDHVTARTVLEGIETADCGADYEFGQDGRPLYIPGPNESPKMMARIIEQLRKRCGEDGFDVMTEEDMEDEEKYAVTIDNPEKTGRLMDGLERSLPFKAIFEERGWQQLARESRVPPGATPLVTVEKLSYSGDFGGILCHLAEHSLVCSLTHLRFDPAFSLYRDIAAYQKRRV
jgi:hypothetical protein